MRWYGWLLLALCWSTGCDEVPMGAPGDAGPAPGHDAGLVDVGAAPADAGPVDTGPTARGPAPTWADCRVAFLAQDRSDALKDRCDALHRQPPEARRYGIRWVFLNTVDDRDAWTTERVAIANALYEAAGLSFQTDAMVEIEDSVIEVMQGDVTKTLTERAPDLAAHLQLDLEDPGELVEALKARLLEVGGDAEAVEALRGNTAMKNQDFLKMMARCHPQSIYVVIGDRPTEQQGVGGFASPPFMTFGQLRRSFIALKTGHTRLTILGHELGHYFGLKHTHAASASQTNSHLFAKRNTANRYRARETHDLWAVLEAALGPNLDQPFLQAYPAYDASAEDLLDFNALRYAYFETWVRGHFILSDDFEPFASFGGFIEAWRNGGSLLQRNYMRTGDNGRKINNCTWQRSGAFACIYPEADRTLRADDPILAGTILFEDGQYSNLMSYIREPGAGAEARQKGLIEAQQQMVRISANAPSRLGLRNHSLEP